MALVKSQEDQRLKPIKRLGTILSAALLCAVGMVGAATPAFAANPRALPHIPVCPGVPAGFARCHADVLATPQGTPVANATTPSGYNPAQFTTAYGVGNNASGQTIAIVDAYDDPNIASDLATYDSTWGLNKCSNGSCPFFTKVNQTGGTSYPRSDHGWALEISLDVQIVHAICPNCNILLVEAKSNSFANLLAAVDYAAAHANVVSMSWGGSEFSSETSGSYDGHFSNSTKAFTASSGDNGYGVTYPSASQHVVAVGGTTLNVSTTGTRTSETAWSGSGSGCSAYEAAESWQKGLSDWTSTNCGTKRAVADVSADADPNTGAAIYDSFGDYGQTGWFQVGGTSLASPLIASIYAIAGNFSTGAAPYTYGHVTYGTTLYDVTTGSNGSCSTIMCNAGTGYDGPTGLGTPNGTGAF